MLSQRGALSLFMFQNRCAYPQPLPLISISHSHDGVNNHISEGVIQSLQWPSHFVKQMLQFHTFLIVLKLVHPRLQAEISHRLMKVQPSVTSCLLVVLLRVVQDCLPSIVLPPLARHLYITGVSIALSLKDVSALWPRSAMSSLRSTSSQQLPLHCPSVDIPGLPLICNPCPTCAPPVQNCRQALHASLGCCYNSVQKK